MTTETTTRMNPQAGEDVRDIQPLSLALVLQLLRQGRTRIGLTGLLTFLLATVFAFLAPTTYTATASFIPPGVNNTSSAAALMGQLSSLGAGSLFGGKTQGDLYVEILRSRTVRMWMTQHFNLQSVYKTKKESSTEAVLASRSTFEVDPKSSVVLLSVTDNSPERARNLTEGYLTALEETTGNLALSESSQRRTFYERRLAQERDELANAEVALKQNQEKTGLIAPAGQTATQIQTLANLNAQISGRRVQLASLLNNESEENPDVVRLHTEIANLQAQADQMQKGQSRDSYGRFSTSQVPELEMEYIRKSRDVQYHLALFGIISKQYEAARLDEAKDSPLQILDHALVPDVPSGPRRKLIMAAGLLAGLILGAAWVLIRTAFGQ